MRQYFSLYRTVSQTERKKRENTDKKKQEHRMQKKGAYLSQKNGELPPLLVWVPLLIVNNYFEFQGNIFSNNRDIRKWKKFSHDADDDVARAMTISRRFLRKQPS